MEQNQCQFLEMKEFMTIVLQKRCQFPIRLFYAMTIHKSQGSTLEKVVLDASDKEFSCGLLYVGLSRVKKFESIVLNPFTYERLMKVCKGESYQKRKKEWSRLCELNLNN